MTYKFVTREEIKKVWPIGKDLEAKDFVNRLFDERDEALKKVAAYRQVAINIHAFDFITPISREKTLESAAKNVDAEAARLLEGK